MSHSRWKENTQCFFLFKVGSSCSSSGNPGLSCASTSRTSLSTGLSSLDPFPASTVADRTWPWSLGWVATTLAMGHLFLGDWFSFKSATSPTWKFIRERIHLFLVCNCCRYSLLHLDQNSCTRCCVRLHLFLQWGLSFINHSFKESHLAFLFRTYARRKFIRKIPGTRLR